MNLFKLVFSFVRRRPLTWAFNVLTLGTGVAMVLALFLVSQAVSNRFDRDLADINLVVGAKGSPLQIVLSTVFQMDVPTGNIKLSQAEALSRNFMVARAVPVSLGDNVKGSRIIGTTPQYAEVYGAELGQGRWWDKPREAVLGSATAARTGLKLGDTFEGSHGLSGDGSPHEGEPYTVVGILKPTGAVIDRVAITDLSSVWELHAHEQDMQILPEDAVAADAAAAPQDDREVTALLIKYRNAMGALMMPRVVGETPDLQAAVPATEMARLFNLLGVGASVLRGIGLAVLGLAAIGFFIALFGAVSQRRRDLAMLRALGGRPSLLLSVVALEAAMMGLAGGLLGVAGGRLLTAIVANISQSQASGPTLIAPAFGQADAIAIGAALGLALLAAVGPAIIAGRTDAAKELANG